MLRVINGIGETLLYTGTGPDAAQVVVTAVTRGDDLTLTRNGVALTLRRMGTQPDFMSGVPSSTSSPA